MAPIFLGLNVLTRWWSNVYRPETVLITKYLIDGQVLFPECVILNANNFYHARGIILLISWLAFIVYWITYR